MSFLRDQAHTSARRNDQSGVQSGIEEILMEGPTPHPCAGKHSVQEENETQARADCRCPKSRPMQRSLAQGNAQLAIDDRRKHWRPMYLVQVLPLNDSREPGKRQRGYQTDARNQVPLVLWVCFPRRHCSLSRRPAFAVRPLQPLIELLMIPDLHLRPFPFDLFAHSVMLRQIAQQSELSQARAVFETGRGFLFPLADRIKKLSHDRFRTRKRLRRFLALLIGLEWQNMHSFAVSAAVNDALFSYVKRAAVAIVTIQLFVRILLHEFMKE